MLPHMHLLSSPMTQQHIAVEQQILSREQARSVQIPALAFGCSARDGRWEQTA